MKVFISWSGQRSKECALVLKQLTKNLIHTAEPWMSSDIESGLRWSNIISDELEQSKMAIICLTRENVNENWILFEAGAIGKNRDANVCAFLLDLEHTDINPPLGQFQATRFTREDIKKLLNDIRLTVQKSGQRILEQANFDHLFDLLWPEAEKSLREIQNRVLSGKQGVREIQDYLKEIVRAVRGIETRLATVEDKVEMVEKAIIAAETHRDPEGIESFLRTCWEESLQRNFASQGGGADGSQREKEGVRGGK